MSKAQKLTRSVKRQEGRGNLSSISCQLSSVRKRAAFTLVEMLVVIGIIAILAAASMVGYSKVVKSAKKAKTQELVSNAATALTQLLSKNGDVWPEYLTDRVDANGNGILDKDVSKIFVRYNLLGLSYKRKKRDGGDGPDNIELTGKDYCGVVDAEAEAVLKRLKAPSDSVKVPSGKTVKEHILHFAIDKEGTGLVKASVEGGGTLEIRAVAVVWAAGPDGVVDYSTIGRNDDVYSWRPSQVKK